MILKVILSTEDDQMLIYEVSDCYTETNYLETDFECSCRRSIVLANGEVLEEGTHWETIEIIDRGFIVKSWTNPKTKKEESAEAIVEQIHLLREKLRAMGSPEELFNNFNPLNQETEGD